MDCCGAAVSDAADGSAEIAVEASTGATDDCGEAASVLSTGRLTDCHRDEGAPASGRVRVAERFKYQMTKAPCNSASTINSQTMDTSTPCGTGIKPMRLGGR
jgi:hypothetical protein